MTLPLPDSEPLPTDLPQESTPDNQPLPFLSCYTPLLDEWEAITRLPVLPPSAEGSLAKK